MTNHDDHNHDHDHAHELVNGHKSEHTMHHEVHDAAEHIDVGAYYEHYKNHQVYRVLGLGFIEATDELAVVYQADYGDRIMFIRPFTDFIAEVDGVERFKKVRENDAV